MRTIKELEKAHYIGDAPKDEELQRLHDHMDQLEKNLRELGPRWHLPWNEARRIRDDCAHYIKNRKRHDEMWGPPGVSEKLLKKCGHLKTYSCNGAMCENLNGLPFNRRF
jgi:hypothetical protein